MGEWPQTEVRPRPDWRNSGASGIPAPGHRHHGLKGLASLAFVNQKDNAVHQDKRHLRNKLETAYPQ
jgi:hypothetical protein